MVVIAVVISEVLRAGAVVLDDSGLGPCGSPHSSSKLFILDASRVIVFLVAIRVLWRRLELLASRRIQGAVAVAATGNWATPSYLGMN